MTFALPSAGEVHVWTARWSHDDTHPHGPDAWAYALLDASERARAEQRRDHRRRAEFVAAHGMLRRVLAAYVACEPAALRFVEGDQGKPALAFPSGLLPRFSLTHSGAATAVAVTGGADVGVDLECVEPTCEVEPIAAHFFAPGEAAALHRRVGAAERRRAFFELWTLKEAYLKGIGTGLTMSLDAAEVTLDQEPPRLRRGVPGRPADETWSLARLALWPDVAGAVAVQGALHAVHVRPWTPPA